MASHDQQKNAALRYARSLQMVFKTVAMFSADHAAALAPLNTSFAMLNELVKKTRQFTIGFVDQRVMLNNILTVEKSLSSLENEFLKRGIGAITFDAGLTLAGYRRALAMLTAQPKVIEEAGGLLPYIEQNRVDFVRIFPASKNQIRNESGDTVLDTDSESFLMAKAFSDLRTPGLEKMEWMLQTAEAMPGSGGEVGGHPGQSGSGMGDGGGMGGGAGVGGLGGGGGVPWTGIGGPPPGPGSGGGVGGGGVPGGGNVQGGGGTGLGVGGGHATGVSGGGSGSDTGAGGSVAAGAVPAGAPVIAPGTGGPDSISRMVEGYFESSLLDSKEQQRSYVELAKVIREMRPEFVLASFSPKRREELRELPPDQMAAEIIEDTAAKWAADRLAKAPSGADALIVEEEVVRVLLRSLQATQTAARLAQKLAKFVQDLQIPRSSYERIEEELQWVAIAMKEKTSRLLKIERFTPLQYRRLITHLKELIKQGDTESASQLAEHYMKLLDESAKEPEPQEISRMPELLRTMSGVRTEFWPTTTERLASALERWRGRQFLHLQVANAIQTMSKTVSLYEEFGLVLRLGNAMEKLATSDPLGHGECCGKGLAQLVTPNSVQRLLELYLTRREEPAFARTAATLLRWSGGAALDKLFRQLEDEPNTANRLALIRLIGRVGPAALEIARKRLEDGRWYVVRNACKLLGDLKDQEISKYIAPALRHKDERVQKAAAIALRESQDPDRARVFADALAHLHHQVQEDVLSELLYLKDPTTLPGLEEFLKRPTAGRSTLAPNVVKAIAAMGGDEPEQALGRLVVNREVDMRIRRAAVAALAGRSQASTQLLRDFVNGSPDDPLAGECAKAMAAKAS